MRRRLRNIFDQYEQKENHITNSLLLVLNSNRKLLGSMLRRYKIKLTSKQINFLSQTAPKAVDERDSVPDAYIYTEDYDFCVGIETKIQTNAIRQEQIVGHLTQLSAYDHSFLLVLTPDENEPSVITRLKTKYSNIRFLSWPELLSFMVQQGPDGENNHVGQYLFQKFVNYMERSYYMTPFTGFRFADGYDLDLATHYVKRVSAILTPIIQKKYPDCSNKRPKLHGPWEAWSPTKEIQKSIHPTFTVQSHQLRCVIVLPNACSKNWKHFYDVLTNPASTRVFKKHIKQVYKGRPNGVEAVISLRQRHYIGRTKAIHDGEAIVNIATLLGVDGSKENAIWWSLLRDVSHSQKRYNYQLEIGYDMKYIKVPELESGESISIMSKCFSSLKPIYEFLSETS